jgi:pimeloyl-ACP methyl ester carboxylesterase
MRLHQVRAGHGKPPIVLVHGMGTSAATWAECVALLQDRFTVVAVDLLGHGGSPVPDDPAEYTRDRALVDLDEVIADLTASTGSPAVMVGHSLGGYLALAHAATRPGVLAGIVVLNTGPGFRDAEKREGWNAMSRRNAHRFGVPLQVAELNLQHDSVVMDRLAEIATPTLVLAGSADRPDYTNSGQYLERKMPHATFRSVEGGGHSMHEHTHAAEVAAAVAAFVGTLDLD